MTAKRSTASRATTARTVRNRTTKLSPPTAVVADSLEELLQRAETSPLERVRVLAMQIRAACDELRDELGKSAAVTAAQHELDQARARVADLEAELAKLTDNQVDHDEPATAPQPAATAAATLDEQDLLYSAEVRTWAKEQGLKVAQRGRIASDIITAYLTAHQ